MQLKIRLIIMNFLQFAVWGAYLTCMGTYLHLHGLGHQIGIFYSIQGIVSIFMPAIIGIIADRWIQAQKMLGISHLISGIAMICAGLYGLSAGESVQFGPLFALYTIGVAFYMPTLALSNSVAYNALELAGLDRVKNFPPIRVFGTIGFIVAMWCVDLLGFQPTASQFVMSGCIGLVLGIYSFSLPKCKTNNDKKTTSLVDVFGLRAFSLFKEKKMAIFFIFSMLLGVSLQITNGFANPFLHSFGHIPEYADTFGVKHANMLISISQISETLCILLIPFFLRKFGIKKVMLIAMFAWVFRFGFFGLGNPGPGVWLFILSCIVYGVAFDFFNISGSLFVDQQTDQSIRASAQGLFMLMTNGIGATVGTFSAQAVLNHFVFNPLRQHADPYTIMNGWSSAWYIFAGYALIVAVTFIFVFKSEYAKEEAN
ncbi:MAG: MFS transporter [Bacteroidales bacterium]|nr:MFS transporter [Bacteroidales bacterium]